MGGESPGLGWVGGLRVGVKGQGRIYFGTIIFFLYFVFSLFPSKFTGNNCARLSSLSLDPYTRPRPVLEPRTKISHRLPPGWANSSCDFFLLIHP